MEEKDKEDLIKQAKEQIANSQSAVIAALAVVSRKPVYTKVKKEDGSDDLVMNPYDVDELIEDYKEYCAKNNIKFEAMTDDRLTYDTVDFYMNLFDYGYSVFGADFYKAFFESTAENAVLLINGLHTIIRAYNDCISTNLQLLADTEAIKMIELTEEQKKHFEDAKAQFRAQYE